MDHILKVKSLEDTVVKIFVILGSQDFLAITPKACSIKIG